MDGKPINRVRVRRILAMDGAERRGFAIMRRISEKFESSGLKTVPDFQSVWIDALVSVELIEPLEDLVGEPVEPDMQSADSEISAPLRIQRPKTD